MKCIISKKVSRIVNLQIIAVSANEAEIEEIILTESFIEMGWDTTTMKLKTKQNKNSRKYMFCVLSFSSVKVDFFSISYRQLEKLVSWKHLQISVKNKSCLDKQEPGDREGL